MAARTVVFVQGGRANEAVYPWKFFHLHPSQEPAPESVNLVYFDYPAGKRKSWNNLLLKRGEPPSRPPDTTEDLTPTVKIRLVNGEADYDGPDRASVLALYNWVKTQPRESIRSLQVFSHGWHGGPILWGSYEYDEDGYRMVATTTEDRDENDTDFRIRDFVGNNPLAGSEGTKFAQAFASDALIKLWGCFAPGDARGLLQEYVDAPKGARGDARRAEALKRYLKLLGLGYAMKLATNLNLSVWACPLGYGSEPGTKVPTNRSSDPPCNSRKPDSHCMSVTYKGKFPPDLNKDQWWRASWFFRNQDGGARFYTDVLKANIDATDFVEHRKAWFDDAQRKASAELDDSGPVDTPQDLQRRVATPDGGQAAPS